MTESDISNAANSTSSFSSNSSSIKESISNDDIRCDLMMNWLHQQQLKRFWTDGSNGEGVILKTSVGKFSCFPPQLSSISDGFYLAITMLNVKAAMTINTNFIKLLLEKNNKPYVPLLNGLRLQVVTVFSQLPKCQKHQSAAFIASAGILVVWDDEPQHLLARAAKVLKELMETVWQTPSEAYSVENKGSDAESTNSGNPPSCMIRAAPVQDARRVNLLQPILTAFTMFIAFGAIGSGWRNVIIDIMIDFSYLRLMFIITVPAHLWLGLFFFQTLTGNFAQLIGPVSQMKENSKYFSSSTSPRLCIDKRILPHVTVQCPIYKEGMSTVIEPTIRSVRSAISTYELQGGSANIFINDDGMQLLPDDQVRARQEYYNENNIGWVARPRHNPNTTMNEKAFIRRGKFKKASNMNYALWVSTRVEAKLVNDTRHEDWDQDKEASVYSKALANVLEEDNGRTWANGDIRVGDYILLIDSDTRVPTDCLLDAVSEMECSPEVAILQFSSGVMNVTSSFFEKGISVFTNLVYTQIRYAVANGDVAPFVGHNAFIRWSAVQEIAVDCAEDNREKFWSENTVSEDFDMALRLQTFGYTIRLAAYYGDKFKEGVSLTVYDELARWEKYAYGCNELIFNPIQYWFYKGPLTALFCRFIISNMPLSSKLTILAYIGTYYALASAWFLTILNYFLVGLLIGNLDRYYIDSFKIYFSIVVVFIALGNFSFAVLRYRIKEKGLIAALAENFKWVPLLTLFLGGISLHLSQAILSHMLSIDMTWGATAKEAENTTFFKELGKLMHKFKYTFLFSLVCTCTIIIFAFVVPPLWRINDFTAIWPFSVMIFSHFMLPIALNPNLMLFTW